MHPIKTPNWIKWLVNPKYCIKVLKLRLRRQMASKEGRKRVWRRVYRWVRKNILIGSLAFATYQTFVERKWRREAERIQAEVEKENSFIRGIVSMRNSDMKQFPFPWWEKMKRGNEWRFLDMNPTYEGELGYTKMESLGKTNEDVFGPVIGAAYSKGDLEVWTVQRPDGKQLVIKTEPYPDPDSLKKGVLVIKYGRKSIFGDSISSGMTVPIEELMEVIDSLKMK